jgi:anhydro-N-acetylmuramic acid kinase
MDGLWAARGQVIAAAAARAAVRNPIWTCDTAQEHGARSVQSGLVARTGWPALPMWRPQDVQATLLEFTAQACAADLQRHAAPSQALDRLRRWRLEYHADATPAIRPCPLSSCNLIGAAPGCPRLQVEAAAFAWLARKTVHRETGSLKSVTGTRGARVLGAIYPR